MEIDHITFAPTGGAGLVAKTLVDSQISLGHNAQLLTVSPGDLRSFPLKHPLLTAEAAFDQFIIRRPEVQSMFTLARRRLDVLDYSKVRADSLIHLHWVEGVVSREKISDWALSGRRIVWTLHDMAPFTGGCHNSLGCENFKSNCESCPMVKSNFRGPVISALEKSARMLNGLDIKLVTPSRWLAKQAEMSTVFRDFEIFVIENPVNDAYFEAQNRNGARSEFGISPECLVGIVISSQLQNPIKRIDNLLKEFFSAAQRSGVEAKFILVGEGGSDLAKSYPSVLWLGSLDAAELAKAISAADFVASASISESAGMTIREAGAVGIPSIVVKNGATEEMVIDKQTGVIVDSIQDIGNVICDLIKNPDWFKQMGTSAKTQAEQHSRSSEAASKYLGLYSR